MNTSHDDDHDLRITAALHRTMGPVPYDAVDWGRLHAIIVGDARGLLQRRQRPWFTYVANWSGATMSIGLAAAVIALFVLSQAPAPGNRDDMLIRPIMIDAVVNTDPELVQVLADNATGVVSHDATWTDEH
jgi:hypothetical protein